MIGVEAIASYLPAGRVSNLKRLAEFGIGEEFLLGKIGVPSVIRRGEDEETSDLCVRAFEALRGRREPGQIGAVIVCTQNPDGSGLPHTAAIVHGKLGDYSIQLVLVHNTDCFLVGQLNLVCRSNESSCCQLVPDFHGHSINVALAECANALQLCTRSDP